MHSASLSATATLFGPIGPIQIHGLSDTARRPRVRANCKMVTLIGKRASTTGKGSNVADSQRGICQIKT